MNELTPTEAHDIVNKEINNYIKDMTKTIKRVKEEWRMEQKEAILLGLPVIYPRVYSNQYYAYIQLIRFFRELKIKISMADLQERVK
jgi:hypothetical protein